MADAVNPQPDESVDGEFVGSVAWRNGLMKNIADAQKAILDVQILFNKLNPYFLPTRQVM